MAPPGSERLPSSPLGLPAPGRDGTGRRPRTSRFAIGLAVLAVGSSLAFLAARSARTWLAAQPAYRIPFGSIRLIPGPPHWYRGGAGAFLEDVRRRARMPETISMLGATAVEVRGAFENNSPWVERVDRVVFGPLDVAVELQYRRPVALVKPWDSDRLYLVDPSAILLPAEDLDEDVRRYADRGGLITINGPGLSAPREPRVGYPWQPRPGVVELAPGNGRIEAAARLAGFLLDRMASIDRSREPALGIRYINPMDPAGRGLFLKNDEGASILWGEAPAEELPGKLSAEEKWERLRDWSRKGRNHPIPEADYWEIRPTEVVHREWKENPAPKSARAGGKWGDQGVIPRIASGQSGETVSH